MAYASLVCLSNTLDENIQLNLIPQNRQYIQTLLQEASYFQDFLEKPLRSSKKIKCLETRIRDVTYKAIDIIESHVADRLLNESGGLVKACYTLIWRILRSICRSIPLSNQSYTSLFQDLDEVMEEINSIKQEVMEIEENEEEEEGHNDEPNLQSRISPPARSLRPPSLGTTTTVGLDNDLMEIKTRLLTNSSKLEIISLVGMGGIGKTTLATKVYDDSYIVYHFDIRVWTTVSQEYNERDILLGLLGSNKTSEESNEELEKNLYRSLKCMRYLIVLDDLWDPRVWDYLRRLFPNDNKGSRILLTTRLEQLAKQANSCPPLHRMRLLNDDESWNLFHEKVFGSDCCPLELEEIGKEIVRNCRGLPLAIKVIGGHLSKATKTQYYWRSVAKNLNETLALEDDKQCSRILSLSYAHLPHYLKGCFLYMSIFPEDYAIEVSQLVHLWIASGLVKEERSKSFGDIYEEYFLDLVERNLIIIQKCIYNRRIKSCKIHDLIRDLCVKEAENERFFHITQKTMYHDWQYFHRVFNSHEDLVDAAPQSRLLRALYWDGYSGIDIKFLSNMVNLRYMYYVPSCSEDWFDASIHKFLKIQTISDGFFPYTLNIWKFSQLRHVKASGELNLADPLTAKIEGRNSFIVLEKLHTLHTAKNLIFSDEVLRRIPNLKKLKAKYFLREDNEVTHVEREDNEATDVEGRDNEAIDWRFFCLTKLKHLHKLESLTCTFYGGPPVVVRQDITFPPSIKKLTLHKSRIPWKDMTAVSSLPNLQVLKLQFDSAVGEEWEPIEGEFLNLKTLHLLDLDDLVHWRAGADHFPRLQHLFIRYCTRLLEIPSGFGEISTLQLIKVVYCPESIHCSAREIEEVQHEFGNEDFQVISDFRNTSSEDNGNAKFAVPVKGNQIQYDDIYHLPQLQSSLDNLLETFSCSIL